MYKLLKILDKIYLWLTCIEYILSKMLMSFILKLGFCLNLLHYIHAKNEDI